MKKTRVLLLLLGIIMLSCNKQELKVPKIKLQGEEEVANHSTIWMFYDKGELQLNENNRISSTNWFFNIDKKLTLNQVLPELVRLRIKHNTKSPHNTKPMHNYFTYVNALNDHLSFYTFDSIDYKFVNKKTLPQFGKDTLLLEMNATMSLPKDNDQIIQPLFNANLSFQDYMQYKAVLENTIKKEYISTFEYIVE